MTIDSYRFYAVALAAGLLLPLSVMASESQAAKLGHELTPVGAVAGANEDGSIPAFSGKWLGAPPHVDYNGHYCPNPYPDEQPLFTITANNMGKYADRLSPGQKALFRKYPNTYKMHVYPTHRDFRTTDLKRKNIRLNARNAHLENNGKTLKGAYGGVAFPVPKSGIELVYNIETSSPAWFIDSVRVARYVHPDGKVSRARFDLRVYNPYTRGNDRDGWSDGDVFSYSISEEKAPPRNAGRVTFTANTFDFSGISRQGWQYDPGTRRLRKNPDVGFDYPQDSGPRVVDEQNGFNGSPERYDWELVGKREMYVPFNSYELDSRDLRYSDFITTRGTPNPRYFRYELRRVWVVEGTLKPDFRHVYAKRRFYVEEDSWFLAMADMYDGRGDLWRTTLNGIYYDYSAKGYYNNVSVYHDLLAGSYSIENMNNEEPNAALLNQREPRPGEFTPSGILRSAQ